MNNKTLIAKSVADMLSALGEDIKRPGLVDTPERVAKSLIELTYGYHTSIHDLAQDALFVSDTMGMVIQRGIEFYSLCEHHMLPFFGQVHVAYLPHQKIIGLSKVGRIIDVFSKRLQVQEHLTYQIAQALDNLLKPRGVAVSIEASHFCMMMRGVKKQGSLTTTREYTGEFRSNHKLRREFLS